MEVCFCTLLINHYTVIQPATLGYISRYELRSHTYIQPKSCHQFSWSKQNHRQLVRSIPRLSAPSCHLLDKINAMGTFFSLRQLCLQSIWLTFMKIKDVTQNRLFPQHLFYYLLYYYHLLYYYYLIYYLLYYYYLLHYYFYLLYY